MSRNLLASLATVVFILLSGCAITPPDQGQSSEWQSLFDGKTLAGWRITDFGNKVRPRVENGVLLLPEGNDMTGVTYTGELPRKNYEIYLDAQRVDRDDFFCGLTFPVGDSHASLIVGGWGGETCGISSIDGNDAGHNETTSSRSFETGRWYAIRVRVLRDKLQAWIDDEQIVDVSIAGREVGVRWEVEPSRPLGIATWRTSGTVRDIRIRRLAASEAEASRAE